MKHPSKASSGQCIQRKARKLDRRKALDQHKRGLSNAEIANLQGVNESTVWRFLERTKPEQRALERFKSGRADELANVQGKAVQVQHLVLDRMRDELSDDRMASALSPSQKSGYLNAATIAGGTAFDKERLERGESTQNISTMSRMLDNRVGSKYKPKSRIADEKVEPSEAAHSSWERAIEQP
jgi:IS30 family transposase